MYYTFYDIYVYEETHQYKIKILIKVHCVLMYFLIYRKLLPSISLEIVYAQFFLSSPLRLQLCPGLLTVSLL